MSTSEGLRSRGSRRNDSTVASDEKMIPSHHAPIPAHGNSVDPQKTIGKITDLTISIPSLAKASTVRTPGPSRWSTREFKFYYAVFILVVPMMVYIPIAYSSPSNPNYQLYSWRLSPGWLFGRKVDNSDHQYHTFRSGLPSLIMLGSIHLAAGSIQRRISPSPSAKAKFTAGFSTLVLGILHGISAFKVLLILWVNYYAAKMEKPGLVGKYWPALVIIGNMGILFLNERYQGYRLGALHSYFDVLDELNGVMPRWHISFNITMLRLVSFSSDYHWRDRDQATNTQSPSDHRGRVTTSLSDEGYDFLNFLGYCLYPPLYIAGPIMTFNDFTWQQRRPLTITTREKISYAIRFIACLLTMEVVLHTMYVVAIKDTSAWTGAGPAQLSMIGFWNLVVVWLKLLIPWRFFRLWALLDGVNPPENMIRCVANNYSTLGFWRAWHRSYNLWVVRYIYIPIGGSKNVILATVLVFTFVALWHDLKFKLLAWGWLVSLFILPELLAKRFVSQRQYGDRPWYRHVAACGGVANILMMMSANLVGFVLGLEGMKHLVSELFSTSHGLLFMVVASSCLFVAVQVMFECREEELRNGIDRKC